MKMTSPLAVGALAAGVLLLGPAIPADAATKYCEGPEVTWRISLWGKRRAVTEAHEYVAETVKAATCGKFNFKLYYGEQLSKSKENLDSIKVGGIDGAMVCASYHPQKVRALGVLDLPFLPVQDLDVLRKVHETLHATEAFRKSLAQWNAEFYISNMLPQYEYMGRGKPPAKLEDFKGMRLRALGGMGAAATAIGAVPTTVPAPETYTALQRGAVDAIGFPYTYTFAAFKLDEISEWYTTNMSLGTPNCFTAVGKDSMAKLPKQYRQILEEAKDGAYDALKKAYAEKDKVNLAKWQKEGKLKAITFPESELEKFRAVGGKPVWEAWVAENKDDVPEAQALLDMVMKTAKAGAAK